MLNMQEFREWLSATAEASDAYQRTLAELTRASLAQVLNVENPLTWFLWTVDQAATAK
ncbi:MAG TPA: hypothetical protein VKF38_03790 [Anaerolineaceae bacterium]|nr:hypothetical protein [Anaerolineaceae bacterium]